MAAVFRRFRLECSDAITREWLLAEAFDSGAEGAEETEFDGRFRADIYASSDAVEAVRETLIRCGAEGAWVGSIETAPEVDWSEAWKEGLEAVEISPRLLVRPPFVLVPERPHQRQIVIDPGQAFGTGGHASTRLCLEWLDLLLLDPAESRLRAGVLDVGTGSGVLALAAVVLGAERALGFDLDPVAVRAAQQAAEVNEMGARVQFFTGPVEAISPQVEPVPLVVANLLKREVLPLAVEIGALVAADGRLVLAGLLEEDMGEVLEAFGEEGFVEIGRRQRADGLGVWVGACLARG